MTVFVAGQCVLCKTEFFYDPEGVCTIPLAFNEKTGQHVIMRGAPLYPICMTCMEQINVRRKLMGEPQVPVNAEAYGASL